MALVILPARGHGARDPVLLTPRPVAFPPGYGDTVHTEHGADGGLRSRVMSRGPSPLPDCRAAPTAEGWAGVRRGPSDSTLAP